MRAHADPFRDRPSETSTGDELHHFADNGFDQRVRLKWRHGRPGLT